MNDERFEQLLGEMNAESVPAGEQEAARERVWERLQRPGCAEFGSSELADYAAGRLPLESRRLLLEDHLRQCGHCRGALPGRRGQGAPQSAAKLIAMPGVSRTFGPWRKWAIAAGVAMMTAYASRDFIDSALAPSGPRATVESVNGRLISMNGQALAPGAPLEEGAVVRTAAGSRASLRLRDGSLVEMNERSQLFVRAAWSGQRVHLERGDAIVQAAKQRRGRLQLVTRDSTASVKGTVFAVSTGVAGSLVSVVEGSVAVEQGAGGEKMLKAGQQAATSASLQTAGVREAIAWSPNAEKYYSLLAEFVQLEEQIAGIATPKLRTSSKLVGRMVPNARLYGAIPNTDGSLQRALELVERRARESAVFREWWESSDDMKSLVQQLQTVSGMLGDEVVFMLATDPAKPSDSLPVILAEVQAGREAALKQAIDKIVTGAQTAGAYTISGSLLVISENAAALAKVQSLLGRGANSPFAQEVARRYQRGAGWLMAIDAASVLSAETPAKEQTALNTLGVGQLRHAFIEQRGAAGRDDNEASVSFQGTRQGVASWLATPGAQAAAEYISQQAILAGAASIRNPRQAFDELVAAIGKLQPNFPAELRRFETETGISVANDLASSFGTDLAFSIETASPTMTGWVGAIEVYSPAAVDAAVKRLADSFNQRQTGAGAGKLELKEETVSGRKWMSIKETAHASTLYWTYDRGYLVATMDRAIGARAIATRASGTPLVRSAAFRERTPVTPGVHSSGFVWFSTRGALDSLFSVVGNQPAALKSLLSSRNPVLILINGETERIAAFSRTRLTSLLLDLMLVAPAGQPQKTAAKTTNATGD